MQFGLAGGGPQVHSTVDCCLADSNHSKWSYLPHVRAEVKGGWLGFGGGGC